MYAIFIDYEVDGKQEGTKLAKEYASASYGLSVAKAMSFELFASNVKYRAELVGGK